MPTRLAVVFASFLVACAAVDAAESPEPNTPPEGFVTLFNGEDLSGWIGVPHFDPRKLREMSTAERTAFLKEHWAEVEKHWTVENGELVNDGKGPYLTTADDYGDFELRLDYKTVARADSGIYLRGNPQVQIWDSTEEEKFRLGADKGSGGLWNNKTHDRFPYELADSPFGEWNTLKITMVGETVTVVLNDKLVVNETVMENYWDRSIPVFPLGPIQLQTHGGEIRFRNVFLKEIARKPPESGSLSTDGQPGGDGWKAVENVEVGKPIGEAMSNFDLHVKFTSHGQTNPPSTVPISPLPSSPFLAFRDEGEAGGPAMVLTMSPETGVTLSERKADEMVEIASTPADASGLKADGENHLYLKVVDDHIQAWVNDVPVIDVLTSKGPTTGNILLYLDQQSVFVRNAEDDPRVETFPGGEEGFTPIYNGKDLTGWTGDVDGYKATPHVLVATKQGGNIYYGKELGDFVFRFEFKLEEGGNSGVGIRVPKGAGATAYEGVESQILDNAADVYATIKRWQTHGSIYGVIPAKRGYLAPAGSWNQQEITVQGSRFKIVLNGKVLLEGDVEPGKTVDGKDHPGLANKTGQLGFLGHNHHIEFRNLRVKTLEAK